MPLAMISAPNLPRCLETYRYILWACMGLRGPKPDHLTLETVPYLAYVAAHERAIAGTSDHWNGLFGGRTPICAIIRGGRIIYGDYPVHRSCVPVLARQYRHVVYSSTLVGSPVWSASWFVGFSRPVACRLPRSPKVPPVCSAPWVASTLPCLPACCWLLGMPESSGFARD